MNAPAGISPSQRQVAIRTLTDLLALQMTMPGGINVEELRNHLRRAADEWDQQGDHGAARLLDQWAHLVTLPVEE